MCDNEFSHGPVEKKHKEKVGVVDTGIKKASQPLHLTASILISVDYYFMEDNSVL